MTKKFVQTTIYNIITGWLEVSRDSWAGVTIPSDLREISDFPSNRDQYLGGTYNPQTGAFTKPAPVYKTVYTKLGFRSRFTAEELIAVDNFAINNTLTTEQKAQLNTITKNFDAAQEIDLTNSQTIAGVNYLADCNLITPARATFILTPNEIL